MSQTDTPGALELRDPRTGTTYPLALLERGTEGDEAVRASDLRAVKLEAGEFGVMSYDPAFMNTASCKSAITFIDGDQGILRYRGYPIEQLAESSTFLEVAYLLRHGELPGQDEYTRWVHDITYHSYVHENIARFLQGFRHDAHPMAMLTSALAALSSFYPKAKDIHDPEQRYISIIRLLSKTPTIAAMIYRHMKGLPVVYPDNSLPYVENYLSMVARMGEPRYEANPCSRARSTCCSSCTPTTSRTARRARCARWARRTSTRSRPWRRAWRRSTARCTAAPTRRCCA
jgi:citrate synthase